MITMFSPLLFLTTTLTAARSPTAQMVPRPLRLPPSLLDANNPTAKALAYSENAATSDPKHSGDQPTATSSRHRQARPMAQVRSRRTGRREGFMQRLGQKP